MNKLLSGCVMVFWFVLCGYWQREVSGEVDPSTNELADTPNEARTGNTWWRCNFVKFTDSQRIRLACLVFVIDIVEAAVSTVQQRNQICSAFWTLNDRPECATSALAFVEARNAVHCWHPLGVFSFVMDSAVESLNMYQLGMTVCIAEQMYY